MCYLLISGCPFRLIKEDSANEDIIKKKEKDLLIDKTEIKRNDQLPVGRSPSQG